ncbi:hypothetical protein MBLNU459_g6906t1 [Dothideomycetes sp. NU459]
MDEKLSGQVFNMFSLPPELVCRIVEFVAPDDLRALRSACHQLKTLTARRFASENFGQRVVWHSWKNLRALVDITAHPEFGPALHTLWIVNGNLEPTVVESIEADIYDELNEGPLPTAPERRKKILAALDRVRTLVCEQQDLEYDRGGFLTRALNNIKDLGHSLKIRIKHDNEHEMISNGYDPDYMYYGLQFRNLVSPFNSLLSAADDTGCGITSLEIDTETLDELCSEDIGPGARDMIRRLKSARLVVPSWSVEATYKRDSLEVRMLHTELVQLFEQHQEIMPFPAGIDWSFFQNSLSELSLKKCDATHDILVDTLRSHNGELQEISLHRVSLADAESWEEISSWTDASLSLWYSRIIKPLTAQSTAPSTQRLRR